MSTPLSLLLLLACAALPASARPPTDANSGASPHASDWAKTAPKWTGPLFDTAAAARKSRRAMASRRHAKVHVLSTNDPLDAGRRICEAVVPRRPPETPILLKPNLSGINRLKRGIDNGVELRTTGADFLRGVIRCLQARGHTHITVTDAWSRPKTQARWLRATGLDRIVAEEHVRFVPMWSDHGPSGAREAMIRAPFPGARRLKTGLLIPRLLARHLKDGLYISIPRLKLHRFAVVTLGIKNTMGFVYLDGASPTRSRRSGMHKEFGTWLKGWHHKKDDRALYRTALKRFSERLVDVLEIELPDAVLIDGVPPVAGDGFALMEPLHNGVAIGSTNPVFADAVGAEYMGYLDNPDLKREIGTATSPIIQEAARRFYGGTELLKDLPITGDDAFRRAPHVAHYRAFPGFEIGRLESPPAPLPWIARALVAQRTTQPPTLDGRLDDPAWRRAHFEPITTDWRGKKAGPETYVAFTWTSDAFWVAFKGHYDSLNLDSAAPITQEHTQLYKFDVVELFLDPHPRRRHRYLEFEFDPQGRFMDIDINRRRRPRGKVAWSSGLQVKTTINRQTRTFVVEACIPAAAFGLKRGVIRPANWRINAYRVSGKRPHRIYQARFPTRTRRPNFHVPDAFGWLRLIDTPAPPR